MGYAEVHNAEPCEQESEPMEVDEQTEPTAPTESTDQFFFDRYGQSLEDNEMRLTRAPSPDISFDDVVQVQMHGKVLPGMGEANGAAEQKQQGPYTKEELRILTQDIADCADQSRRQAKTMLVTLSSRGTPTQFGLLKFDVEYQNMCWSASIGALMSLYKADPTCPDMLERASRVYNDLTSTRNRRRSHDIVTKVNVEELAAIMVAASAPELGQDTAKFFTYATIVLLGNNGFQNFGRELLDVYYTLRETSTPKHEGVAVHDVIMLYMISTVDHTNVGKITAEELGKVLSFLSTTCLVDHYKSIPQSHYEWLEEKFQWRDPAMKLYGLCNQLLALIIRMISVGDKKVYDSPHDDGFISRVTAWLKENSEKVSPELTKDIEEHMLRYAVSQLRWYGDGEHTMVCWTPPKAASAFILYSEWIKTNSESKEWDSDKNFAKKLYAKTEIDYFSLVYSYLQNLDISTEDWIHKMMSMGVRYCRSLMIQHLMLIGKWAEAAQLIEKFMKNSAEGEEMVLGMFQVQLYALDEKFVKSLESGLELVERSPFRDLSRTMNYTRDQDVMSVISRAQFYNYVVDVMGYSLWRIASRCPESLLNEISITLFVMYGQFAWNNGGFEWIDKLVNFLLLQADCSFKADFTNCVTYPSIICTLKKLPGVNVATYDKQAKWNPRKLFETQQMFAKYFFENKAGLERLESLDVNSGAEKNVKFPRISTGGAEDDPRQQKFKVNFG
uniref:Nuclear pore protein n=1 Tax=Steinernema glaseri TaxID=37863 RepID=A0A1I8A3Y1_9BILA